MNPHEEIIRRLAELAELGHSASPGFIRQVAEDATKALDSRAGDAEEGQAASRVIYLLQGDNSRLAGALRACRDQFSFYASEHTAAGKSEKAATNARFAKIADDALTAIKPATPAPAVDAPITSTAIAAGECTCQRYPTHQANDCPTHGLEPPFDGVPHDVQMTEDEARDMLLHNSDDAIVETMREWGFIRDLAAVPKAASAPAVDAVPAGEVERIVEQLCGGLDGTQPGLMSAYRQGVRDAANYLSAALSHGEGRKPE